MADTKITALTAITTVDPAADVLPIVDVSDTSMAASGTTKKITSNQILGAGGTATLASATITGNLTVQTNKLFVNANGAAVGTTSIFADFQVQRSTNARLEIDSAAASLSYQVLDNARTGYLQHNVYASQHLWFNGVTEAMRLNSTGLGVGRSPSYRLQASSGTKATTASLATVAGITTTDADDFGIYFRLKTDATGANRYASITSFDNGSGNGARDLVLQDLGGNVGIGVTPAAKLHVEGSGPQARFSVATAVDARHEYYRNGIREGLLYWDANLIGLYATQSSGELVLASANTIRVRINSAGDTISNVTATPPTLSTNRQMVFNLTSDTNLRISVRGSDGVTRTTNLTLA